MTGESSFDLLVVLTYYEPYVSGLTQVARVVAEGMAARGRRVGVVCSRHKPTLPRYETVNGVHVHRTPVGARAGKGVVSPRLPIDAARLLARSAVGFVHLPMIDAGLALRLARGRAPIATFYHCDVELSERLVDRVVVSVLDRANRAALRRSDAVVVSSRDYAAASRLARHIPADALAIPPPCADRPAGTPRFRETKGLHVGFLGRIVAEKGLEHLVRAFKSLPDGDARLLIAGDFSEVAGGSVVDELRREIDDDDDRVRLLGFVPEEHLADFYRSIDVFVLPSVGSLEAFGIVQVEAMLAGVPVVATDRPGVRVPVQETGFGVLVPPGDPRAIAAALERLPADVRADDVRQRARSLYGVDAVLDRYEELFDRLARR